MAPLLWMWGHFVPSFCSFFEKKEPKKHFKRTAKFFAVQGIILIRKQTFLSKQRPTGSVLFSSIETTLWNCRRQAAN